MNDGKQLAAARALLGWTQSDLSKKADVTNQTIIRLENNEVQPNTATIRKITHAINKGGVVFTDNGVELVGDKITKLEGSEWFLELLEGALDTLSNHHNKEFLIFGGDNTKSSPAVVDGFRKLREAGIYIREMVEEGNTYLMADVKSYRWIPQEYYRNYCTFIYADKVCNDFINRGLLIQNADWAETERNKFNLVWSLLPELQIESTSNVRY